LRGFGRKNHLHIRADNKPGRSQPLAERHRLWQGVRQSALALGAAGIIGPCALCHNSVIEMVALYKEEHVKLTDLFPPPSGAQDQLLFGFYTKQQWLALQPQMINVNSVIEQLREHVANAAKEADDVLGRLQKLL
jgi:hypothetical protein